VPEADAPLILTLALDEAAFGFFESLRRRHFPPERNFLPAHLTLFHHLPGQEEAQVLATLAEFCRAQAPMALEVQGLRFLGRGVAFALRSAALEALRGRLAEAWAPWLGAQDRQRFQPHVTVQNKVTAERARRLMEELQAGFAPFAAEGRGLLLWRYLGGPWAPVASLPFRASANQ
jgi:hypothetical protein